LRSSYRRYPVLACKEIWSRLDERYGKTEIVHQTFTRRIESFSRPTYTGSHKWYELSDLLNEILALTEDQEGLSTTISLYDSSIDLAPILAQLFNKCSRTVGSHGQRLQEETYR
jgi:hypothetical protein